MLLPAFRKLFRKGAAHVQAQRLADGSLRNVEVSPSRRTLLHSIIYGITEHKQMEESLRESEANFSTFFETMTDMIMVGTPEGRILFTNASVARTLGYTPDDLSRMHLLDLHPQDRRSEAEAIFTAMFRGERESCPLPLARKDGGLVPVETRVWFGKWNGTRCLFGICKSLSAAQEAKQAEDKINRHASLINSLLDSTSDIIFYKDIRGVYLGCNPAFTEFVGKPREAIIGRSDNDLFAPEIADVFKQNDQRMLALCEPRRNEEQITYPDGRQKHIDTLKTPYWGPDGLLIGILGVSRDITERKRTEAEFARLSAFQGELMHLATAFVNIPLDQQDAAIDQSLALMGQLIQADRAYLFAYSFSEGTMSNTHEWCGEDVKPAIDNLQAIPNALFPDWVEAHLRGSLVHIPSVAALPPDSSLRQVLEPQGIRSLITLPLMQDSACLGFVGFDAVLEERKWREEEVSLLRVLAELYSHFQARRTAERETRELQQRLTQARDEAQAAVLAKSLFLGNMSHEIRTPLNAILGHAQIMERECRNCPTGQRLNAITRSGQHLLELLTDLLELVRSDAHIITLTPTSFDLYRALEDALLMFARSPAAQTLKLEALHSPEVPRFIRADSGKIRQILVNLLGNAVKFTEKGSVRLSASVLSDSTQEGRMLAVDVEDTGCGISDDEIGRIFDVFEQTASSRKSGKGTGLGLHLSRRYARALGGDLTATSRPGIGSRFRFTFRAQAESDGSAEHPRQGNVRRLASDQRTYRALVVDDDLSNRDVLAGMLTAVGFRVETADCAPQALHRLSQADDVDLVLIDKCMPEMDGYESIGHIRKLTSGRDLPILVVTASCFADENALAMAAGASGLVAKPVLQEQLFQEIGRVANVRYEYERAPPSNPVAAAPSAPDPEALARLPADQLLILDQALHSGDILLLRKTVAQIACEQAELAAGIRVIIDAYDYERLLHLLGAARKETRAS
jgi:PAS domain S-box-containing protein